MHNKKNVDHHNNSSQNRGRNQATEGHIYTGDEHHDGTNMGRDQGIVTQSDKHIKLHKKQVLYYRCTPQVQTNQATQEASII
jgi:hypothetical protein